MPKDPASLNVLYSPEFKQEFHRLTPSIQRLFEVKDQKFQEGKLSLYRQGIMHYIDITDVYAAMGVYPKYPDVSEFLWISILMPERYAVVL